MSIRVLVVEDDLIQQQVLERFLTSQGYCVATAATGMEAVKKIRDDRFDVIILDYAMPDFDGVDAARWIRREITGFIQPCLIALSANIDDMLSNELGAEKIFDHIEQKPWNPRALLSVLQSSRNSSGLKRTEQAQEGNPQADRPVADCGSPSVPPEDDADMPLLQVTTCQKKVRVLILDRDDSVLSTFQVSLEKANYEVSLANSQAEAIDILRSEPFDVVFADYFGTGKFCGSPAAFLRQAVHA